MKLLSAVIFLVFALTSCAQVDTQSAPQGGSYTIVEDDLEGGKLFTPEAQFEKEELQPAITEIIEEDDYKKALVKVNTLHGDMTEDGYEVNNLVELIDNGDFEGFIVTYRKKKQTASSNSLK